MQPAAATGKQIAIRKLRPQWVFGFLNVWKSVCMEVTVTAESDLSFPSRLAITSAPWG